jgi:hypothetical protein
MDLLSIARKIWRHKLLAVPVVMLTICGAVYVIAVRDPVYEASSSYIMAYPPDPPTPEEIARDPALGRTNANNPYTRFSDQAVMVEVLASSTANESTRRALRDAGADPRYTVKPAAEFGSAESLPIVKITAQGSTPEVAIRSAKLVGHAVSRQLQRMQEAEGVDAEYQIRTNKVDTPTRAELQASGQLRALVGVLALGTVLLFLVMSVGDALTTLRMERSGGSAASPLAADGAAWSPEGGRSRDLSALDPEEWPKFDDRPLGGDEPVQLFPDYDSDAMANASSARRLQHGRKQHRSRRTHGRS